jgi:hypothetical protein
VEVLRSALRHGVDSQEIHHALGNALLVEEIGEDPTRYLVLGPDHAGNFLELVVLDRPPGPGCDARDAHARQVPALTVRRPLRMPMTHGTKADGTPITDQMVEAMADQAEQGYDVEEMLRRRQRGRPAMGSAASSVESVRLDPELKRDLLLRAAEEHTSVSEIIRSAVRQYLRAS